MPHPRLKFAFVSNSIEIGKIVEKCIDPRVESLRICLASMEEAVSVARTLLDDGIEVILGGWGTGSFLIKALGHPVVKIERTYLDILNALLKAKDYDSTLGLTCFGSPIPGLDIIENLLSVKVEQIVFNSTLDLVNGITAAVERGTRCIVGGGVCRDIISSLGGRGFIVLPSQDTIIHALQEARAIALARRREKEDATRLTTVLQTIKEGVILIDTDGKVKLFNETAADILGIELQRAIGHPLPAVAKATGLLKVLETGRPETDIIRRIGNVNIIINAIPVIVNGENCGVVATVKEASRIQNIERKLRETLYAKRFTTKYNVDQIVHRSDSMAHLLSKARRYAETEATVLIQGETGTGKELFAQSIHNLSKRRNSPFIAVNCSALPESLLESELFGYEEGAFTGAKRGGKIGLFELANTGTIFLDEIADLSSSLQAKLLRVLEEKEIMRIGGDRVVPVDVRIISSSYKDLWADILNGKFRMDLYFRLEILKLIIPPLRERLDDIPLIAQECLNRAGNGTKYIGLAMLEQLKRHPWPGNIRELDALMTRYATLLGDRDSDDRLFAHLLDELGGTP